VELPIPLIDRLTKLDGFDTPAFLQAHDCEPPVSVRFNPHKPLISFTHGFDGRVPWSSRGFYLPHRPKFTLDPALHAGAYYVQEASSMFVEHAIGSLLGDAKGLMALDLCAAPGGKATLLASMPQFGMVLANEVVRARSGILCENAVKWGDPKVMVSNNDPAAFSSLGPCFDVMLVDAPCSGSGMFRKDPDALKEWSLHHVQLCSQRQKRILADALPSLRPGGLLVYSTCSYSPEEDEDVLEWIMQHEDYRPLSLDPDPQWGIQMTRSISGALGYRFFPDKVRGEGFFLACFSKGALDMPGDALEAKPRSSSSHDKRLNGWVDAAADYRVREKSGNLFLLPSGLEYRVMELDKQLNLRKSGVKAGTLIRDELVPDHELALSRYLSGDSPFIELDLPNALKYLRKQEILPQVPGRGWFVVRHQGLALGLVKHLGNRVNNYYPASWRILMS